MNCGYYEPAGGGGRRVQRYHLNGPGQAAAHVKRCSMVSSSRLLTAWVTVRDSWELRWWLIGRADQVQVLSPDWLRREIGETLRKAWAKYQ